jgi:transcriptional regulator with XRE-family HTH domain
MSGENVFARRLDYMLSKLEWGDIKEKLIKAGISYSNLQWWRTGRHLPKLDKFMALADALGVPLKAYHVASEFLDAVGPYDYAGGLLGDKANTVLFDNAKLKRAVPGFQATVRYEQGIRQTVANILAHPELQVPDPAFDAWCDRVIAALEETKRAIRP